MRRERRQLGLQRPASPKYATVFCAPSDLLRHARRHRDCDNQRLQSVGVASTTTRGVRRDRPCGARGGTSPSLRRPRRHQDSALALGYNRVQ